MTSHTPLDRKIIITGNEDCGKSSLAHTLIYGKFDEASPAYFISLLDKMSPEMHNDQLQTTVLVDGVYLTITLWDTFVKNGYERLRPLLYPKTSVVIICFSIVSPPSLARIEEMGEAVAKRLGATYFECSAKAMEGIDDIIELITQLSLPPPFPPRKKSHKKCLII
ncbi:GTP-binding protein Rho1 [Entomortierella beljakovae]|nr:GTP-binding protein Rho1 [Entomortierella beljakovae]